MNLWDHQQRAIAESVGRPASMLEMGMGTGKTLCALALAEEWGVERLLVLCTKSGIDVWPTLLQKHLDDPDRWETVALRGVSVVKRAKAIVEAAGRARLFGRRLMVVVNYQASFMDPMERLLLEGEWDMVALDEIHRIKAPEGRQNRLAREICRRTERRLGLTGTLMPNSPLDAFAPYNALDPTRLGDSFTLYKSRYCKERSGVAKIPPKKADAGMTATLCRLAANVPGGDPLVSWLTRKVWGGTDFANIAAVLGVRRSTLYSLLPYLGLRLFSRIDGWTDQAGFEAAVAPITFSCLSDDVLDLPPKTYVIRTCTLGKKARDAYTELEQDLRVSLDEGQLTVSNGMVKGLRAQQIACGHLPFGEGDAARSARIDTAKQDLLEDVLEDLQPPTDSHSGEAVVVFCRFVGTGGGGDLDAAHEAAKKAGHRSLELSGRRHELAAWQRGEANVLVCQIQAGSESVDMTRARYGIYFSGDWSLGTREQSEARIRRPGQTRPVTYIDLVAEGTVDEDIVQAYQTKSNVVESFLEGLRRRTQKGRSR